MIIYTPDEMKQGSDEWLAKRLKCIATTSQFVRFADTTGRLRGKKKPAVGVMSFVYERLADQSRGYTKEIPPTPSMMRGTANEQSARNAIGHKLGTKVEPAGFVTTDDGKYGCSPDGWLKLNGETCGFETKSLDDHNHLRVLYEDRIPPEYLMQVHGGLAVSGFSKWIFYAYNDPSQSRAVNWPSRAFVVKRSHVTENLIRTLRELDSLTKEVGARVSIYQDVNAIIKKELEDVDSN